MDEAPLDLGSLLDHLPGMIYRLRAEGERCPLFLSAGCRELTGHDPHEVLRRGGEFLRAIAHPDDRAWSGEQIERALAAGQPYQLSYRIVTAAGSERWVWDQGRGVRDERGRLVAIEGFLSDATEHHRLSKRLTFQASHDALTGLLNRRAFEERVARVLESAHRDGSEHALCYLDLDQFKVINDTCGHFAGDELLRQLTAVLQRQVRKRDTLARLGGDEFGVLMEHCTLLQARRAANALRAAIEEFRFVWRDRTFAVGASIGVAAIGAASQSVANVLSAADSACYVAKDRGRNRVHLYRADDLEVERRSSELEWVSRLSAALDADRMCLVYQPIWALDPGARTGPHYELLVRMVDPDGSLIAPGAFLPAAERYNLSVRLDRWVVERALAWLAARPGHVAELDSCALNLSGHSLADDDFLAFVIERLERSGVPAHKLCFEVTETVAIASLAAATRFMRALRELGARFALDDFGSGLSSFAYLKALPVDALKIDGIFVKDLDQDPIDLAMVRSINDIGHVMGKRTIAEFVEDDEVLGRLLELGVDYAQGYGLGRPRPLEELG